MNRLIMLAALLASPLSAQTRAPELPRSVPATTMPVTTRVLTVAVGGNLQAALDSARGGDAIEIACGFSQTAAFSLPVKAGTAWVVVRPSCWRQLPPEGTRITPAIAAALTLPILRSSDAGYAIGTVNRAHHYRLVGLEVTLGANVGLSYGLVGFGSDRSQGQRTLADAAHDLVLDRLYVHGNATISLRRCLALNSGSAAIVDSYLADCHDSGSDAQAIGGWNGPGPFLIRNNYLEGSTENIMFGGSDAAAAELSPADITIQRNHLRKPIAWKGSPWQIKTLLELKNAKRVLVEGNVLEGNWPQAWDGTAVTFKSVNQDHSAPWSGTTDVTMRRNLIRHVGSGINLHSNPQDANDDVVRMQRVAVTENLVLGENSALYPGSGRGFFLGGSIADLLISHNTITWVGGGRAIEYEGDPPDPFPRTTITSNLFATVGGGGLTGQRLGFPGPVWAAWAPGGVMTGNVFAVGPGDAWGSPGSGYNSYPPGNRLILNPDTLFASIGFAGRGDLRLAASSPHTGFGADGRDPGADVPAVLAAVTGVVEGSGSTPVPSPTPTPDPTPAPAIALSELRTAITALDKVLGPTGRESLATKRALSPLQAYLKALEQVVP